MARETRTGMKMPVLELHLDDDERELAHLRQPNACVERGLEGIAGDTGCREGIEKLQHDDAEGNRQDSYGVVNKVSGIQKHAQGHEKDAEKNVPEGCHARTDLVVEFRVAYHQPRQKGAQCKG